MRGHVLTLADAPVVGAVDEHRRTEAPVSFMMPQLLKEPGPLSQLMCIFWKEYIGDMKEIFDALAGDILVFGYSVPILWLIAGGFLLLVAGKRALSLMMIAGLITLALYAMTTTATVSG